jgi:hypothetical protein
VPAEFLFSLLTNRQVVELELSVDALLESVADALHFNFEIAEDLHKAFRAIWPDPEVSLIRLEPRASLFDRHKLEMPCHSSTPSTASTKA